MIHYQTIGSGTNWLVFVHGLTCDSTDWDHQIQALKDDFQCLTVDLRGHGKSRPHNGPLDIETHASDVNQILRSLNINGALLVGHSMGTRVVASAAIQAPECTSGLVFIDGSIQAQGEPLQAANDVAGAISRQASITAFTENMFSMMFTPESDRAMQSRIVQRAVSMNPQRLVEQLRTMMMWDAGRAAAVFSQLEIPLSMLQSTAVGADKKRTSLKDGEVSEYVEMVKQLAPHATSRIIEDCGHFTQLEAIQETNEFIRNCATQVFSSS